MIRAIVFVPLLLMACAPSSGGPPLSKINPPPKEWLEPAKRLPNTPACEELDPSSRIDCRAKYDRTVRGAYVALANRHAALVDYIHTLENASHRGR